MATATKKIQTKPTTPLRLVHSIKDLPQHEHADTHALLIAQKEFGTKERLRALKKQYRASGEIACDRIREFAWDLGKEVDWAFGWKAKAAERLGLSYSTMWYIISHTVTSISTRTVDHVAMKTGVPVRVFYDAEV